MKNIPVLFSLKGDRLAVNCSDSITASVLSHLLKSRLEGSLA